MTMVEWLDVVVLTIVYNLSFAVAAISLLLPTWRISDSCYILLSLGI